MIKVSGAGPPRMSKSDGSWTSAIHIPGSIRAPKDGRRTVPQYGPYASSVRGQPKMCVRSCDGIRSTCDSNTVKGIGEPRAREGHARFDGGPAGQSCGSTLLIHRLGTSRKGYMVLHRFLMEVKQWLRRNMHMPA